MGIPQSLPTFMSQILLYNQTFYCSGKENMNSQEKSCVCFQEFSILYTHRIPLSLKQNMLVFKGRERVAFLFGISQWRANS